MTVWQQLEITTHANYAEEIADLLNEHGALSVSFNDAGNQALFQLTPDDTPLWSQTKITALFLQTVNIELILQHIKQSTSHTMMDYQISTLQDQDWVRQTQQNFPPQCFSEILWVIPSWCNSNHYGNHTIKIDPGLAFGTGTHPTTALCLEWLAQHPPRDMTVIDFGCGSGILSLAALAMGAKEVYAIDHDPQALQATKNNPEHFVTTPDSTRRRFQYMDPTTCDTGFIGNSSARNQCHCESLFASFQPVVGKK